MRLLPGCLPHFPLHGERLAAGLAELDAGHQPALPHLVDRRPRGGQVAQIAQAQAVPYQRTTCTAVGSLDYAAFAAATGCGHVLIGNDDDLEDGIAGALAMAAANKPVVVDVRIDYAWGGTLSVTVNRLPHVGRLPPNLFFAQGYSGHGISTANFAGKVLAEAICGSSDRFEVFADLPTHTFPGGTMFRYPGMVLGMLYYSLKDRL